MEETVGRVFRAEFRIVLFAVCFLASLLMLSLARSKQTCSTAHLGGIGADSRDVDFNPLGDRSIRSLEIFHLDVSGAGIIGG